MSEVRAPPSVSSEVDEMVRALMVLSDGAENKFLELLTNLEVWLKDRMNHKAEVSKLQSELVKSQANVAKLEKRLDYAQHLLGLEKEKRIMSENQLKSIFQMMERMKSEPLRGDEERVLSALSNSLEQGRLSADGTRGFNVLSPRAHLSTIDESANTLDAVSDIDLTEGDELEVSSVLGLSEVVTYPQSSPKGRRSKGRKSSNGGVKRGSPTRTVDEDMEIDARKCKQPRSEQYDNRLHYTPSAPPLSTVDTANYTPSQKRQAPPPPKVQMSQYSTPTQGSPLMRSQLSASRVQTRAHCFYTKAIYMNEHCQPCGKKIRFGKTVLKCRDCRAVCHPDCRDAVPVPCVPTVSTPSNKNHLGSIADFTPCVAPMVPALVVHCTNEVERRGLSEMGIYRVSALEREVKELKEKFLRGKGLPSLHNLDIHVICCTIKHFLRGLKEPLIIHSLWQEFVIAANKREESDCEAALYQAVSELPQPNRDTLAWMIIHLQRVGEAKECMMPTSNLAKVFGPTLVGYSESEPEPEMILRQTPDQQQVMSKLLAISSDYWEKYTRGDDDASMFGGVLRDSIGVVLTPTNLEKKTSYGGHNRRRSIISKTPLK